MPEDPKRSRRSGVELAQTCSRRLQSLKSARLVWDAIWDEAIRYIMPRKAGLVYNTQDSPTTAPNDVLFDTTAVFANRTFANGQLSYMTPADSPWFNFDPPPHLSDNDEVKTWLQTCKEITQAELATSNFYPEIHELYHDDGCIGTTCILVLPGKAYTLNFKSLPVGSFWIDEDDEGIVDTLFREIKLTARQAELKFGFDALSPKMKQACAESQKSGKEGQKFCIGHAIYPRCDEDREYGKKDGKNKPFASIYWVEGENHTLSESGYDERPFFASRYDRQGDTVYGKSPGMDALPEARQLNFLTKQMDALAEVAAFPRFLCPSNMVDEIDIRAGGMTVFDENNPSGSTPKEWMTTGRYDIGKDREAVKKSAIERFFFVDLFQMFAQYKGPQMTAREVAEREAEKLVQFTPAFARKTTELFNPLLKCVFGILLRAGKFPPPPQEILVQTTEGVAIPDPNISYNSKVALAIKALQNTAFFRTMETIGPIAQTRPEVLDNYDFDKISRDASRNDGLPADWMRSVDDRDKMRAARAQAMQEQQQRDAALAMSQAAKNVGGIKADSPVAKAVAQQVQQ